ncbi:hypothetical protein C3747_60g678c [Trypanosoma cruzi]|uniref:Uncharacterized protein n=1 Tax=Trypanosoma cruzi TaxID=5693 RepID=A0A2V2WS00_TRYCR|nr:hypothetical protein C3747_60g678c [Trypanosoma cruzi]RNC30360.1 hypothetical protein TcCL_Unassigned07125 [Trypanosoma cruzi]
MQRSPLTPSGSAMYRHIMACLRVRRSAAVLPIAVTTVHVWFTSRRWCAGFPQGSEASAKLLELMDAFSEARELIEEAKESAGTVYAAEDMQEAKEQTEKTLALWRELQAHLESSGNLDGLNRLRREHDFKMSQLCAELEDAANTVSHD